MPSRKKSDLSRNSRNSVKSRLRRSQESIYERDERLTAAQEYQASVRASNPSSQFQQVQMMIAAGFQMEGAQDALIPRECRACLQKIGPSLNFYNLFQAWDPIPPWNESGGTISDDLTKLAGISLSETDRYSKLICGGCCMKLHTACQFIFTVKKSDQVLQERHAEVSVDDKTWPKPIQLEKSINGTLMNTMDVEIKQEVLSEDEYGTTGVDEGYHPELDIKIEPEEILEPSTIKVTVNGTITPEEMNAENPVKENSRAIYEKEEHLEANVKEEPMSEDEDTDQIHSDIPLVCMLCAKILHSVSGLKAHVIAQHSYKTVKRKTGNESSPKKKHERHVCATCRRSFVTSTDLMVHETCHNKSVCYGCTEKFDTFEQLTKHRKRCKAILNKEVQKPKFLEDVMRPLLDLKNTVKKDTKEGLKCSICSEEYSDTYYMKIHHEIHHNQQKEDSDQIEKKDPYKESEKSDQTQSEVTENDKMETKSLQIMFEQKDKNEGHVKIKISESLIQKSGQVITENKSEQKEIGNENENVKIKTESLQIMSEHTDENEKCVNISESLKQENRSEQKSIGNKEQKEKMEIESQQIVFERTDENKIFFKYSQSFIHENAQPLSENICKQKSIDDKEKTDDPVTEEKFQQAEDSGQKCKPNENSLQKENEQEGKIGLKGDDHKEDSMLIEDIEQNKIRELIGENEKENMRELKEGNEQKKISALTEDNELKKTSEPIVNSEKNKNIIELTEKDQHMEVTKPKRKSELTEKETQNEAMETELESIFSDEIK